MSVNVTAIYHWMTTSFWGTVIVSVVIASVIIPIIIWRVKRLFKQIWPDSLNWEFITEKNDYPENVYDVMGAVRWHSETEQRAGMSYQLDMRKIRVISEFAFFGGSRNEVPEEWRAELIRTEDIKYNVDPTEGSIIKKLDKPFKARYIRIIITKPRSGKIWRIRKIQIAELRLFGHFCRRIIKTHEL